MRKIYLPGSRCTLCQAHAQKPTAAPCDVTTCALMRRAWRHAADLVLGSLGLQVCVRQRQQLALPGHYTAPLPAGQRHAQRGGAEQALVLFRRWLRQPGGGSGGSRCAAGHLRGALDKGRGGCACHAARAAAPLVAVLVPCMVVEQPLAMLAAITFAIAVPDGAIIQQIHSSICRASWGFVSRTTLACCLCR